MHRFALLLICGALAACEGGEGEDCKSNGIFAARTCDEGLVCNEAVAEPTCEKAMTRLENQPCSTGQLCAAGLWCDLMQSRCRPWLKAGDPCIDPTSCGPDLICLRDAATMSIYCGQAPRDAVVVGTLTLPRAAPGAGFSVRISSYVSETAPSVAMVEGVTGDGTSLDYEIRNVLAGPYWMFALVDVDGSGVTASTPGDFAGWFGHNGDGNPPGSVNLIVPTSGTIRADFSLVVR